VRPQERKQIALGLIGDHLDDVGQVLAFARELHHGTLVEFSHLDALGNVAVLIKQPGHASEPCAATACSPSCGTSSTNCAHLLDGRARIGWRFVVS